MCERTDIHQTLTCHVSRVSYVHPSSIKRSRRMLAYAARWSGAGMVSALALTLGACGNTIITDTVPPQQPLKQAYWSLSINYKAINLALRPPYDTLQLHATPYNALGEPIGEHANTATFTVLDTTRLRVAPGGKLSARATGSNILVVATLQIGTVTHVDTAFVKIAAAPPVSPLASLSIQPSDSARWSVTLEGNKTIRAVAQNAAGGNIANLQVAYRSSNRQVALIENSGTTNGSLEAIHPGRVWIVATTYAYGVYRTDSVEYHIGIPGGQFVDVVKRIAADGTVTVAFVPETVTIGVGGAVMWMMRTRYWKPDEEGPGITFEQPDAALPGVPDIEFPQFADSGNIPRMRNVYAGWAGARRFTQVGTYTYRDDRGRSTGRIIVKEAFSE